MAASCSVTRIGITSRDFPFFAPLFVPGGHWDIYGPAGLSQSLRETLAGQMEHIYFPVAHSMSSVPASFFMTSSRVVSRSMTSTSLRAT